MEEFVGLMIVFMIFMSLIWLLVPFAIFGIKPILRSILVELVKMNKGQNEAFTFTHHYMFASDKNKHENPNKQQIRF